MIITAGIVICIGLACLFGYEVPLTNLFDVFPQLTTFYSIVLAALLVRLNRGMPTLDWKGVEKKDRSRLTSAVLSVTKEYCQIIALAALMLILIITLSAVGKVVTLTWSERHAASMSALLAFLGALCIWRMGYVVWRDYDIVRLQKHLVDAAGEREFQDSQIKAADQKVLDIRGAGLRRNGSPEVKVWGES